MCLAIVDSIVRLSNADNPAAYASAVQERVQSLARAHALLSENSWKAMVIRNVIEAQISRYPDSHITMSGPEYLVVPEAVQPLSLLIHELAVNAVTHGALSRHGHGRLAIAWEPRPEDGRLIMIWTESGGVDCH